MHLTNYSINKMSSDYERVSPEDVLTDSQGTKRTLTALYKSLAESGIDVDKIKANIASTCSKIMQIYGPMMTHQFTALTAGKAPASAKVF